jgi:hypothetical protein
MIPLRDTTRSRTTPFVNYTLIGMCGLVFFYELSLGESFESFLTTFGVVPSRIEETLFRGSFEGSAILPLLTSMFLHGGWAHLIGNMLYLYVFGDNVEDRLGHKGYILFYVLSGIGAALLEVFFQQGSTVPLIGASGAIAGVLGAYFLLYPRARILTLIPLFVFFPTFEVPAFFFLGFWFVLQFLQGAASSFAADGGGGIAWWAHAGGFIAGALLLPVFLFFNRR